MRGPGASGGGGKRTPAIIAGAYTLANDARDPTVDTAHPGYPLNQPPTRLGCPSSPGTACSLPPPLAPAPNRISLPSRPIRTGVFAFGIFRSGDSFCQHSLLLLMPVRFSTGLNYLDCQRRTSPARTPNWPVSSDIWSHIRLDGLPIKWPVLWMRRGRVVHVRWPGVEHPHLHHHPHASYSRAFTWNRRRSSLGFTYVLGC